MASVPMARVPANLRGRDQCVRHVLAPMVAVDMDLACQD